MEMGGQNQSLRFSNQPGGRGREGRLVAGGLGAGRALGTLYYMESGVRTRIQPLGEVS